MAGCRDEARLEEAVTVADPTVGNEFLGIDRFVTTETDSELVIRGLDADGNQVAYYRVFVGTVFLEEDWEQRSAYGRQVDFSLSVNGKTYRWADEGTNPVTLLMWKDESDALVTDPYVSEVLARWGVTYLHPDVLRAEAHEEQAYYHYCDNNCDAYSQTPCPCAQGGGFADVCSDHDTNVWQQFYRCNGDPNRHWFRICGLSQGTDVCDGGDGKGAGPAGCDSCGSWTDSSAWDAQCNDEYVRCEWM